MKLEIGKEYVTRSGLKAKVYDIAEKGVFPLIAGVYRGCEVDVRRFTVNGTYFINNRESSYDIIGEWQEPLEFDWSCLPPWINEYIAMDENGLWFAYSMMPKMVYSPLWRREGGEAILIPVNYAPKNFKGSWENSLFKNPKL